MRSSQDTLDERIKFLGFNLMVDIIDDNDDPESSNRPLFFEMPEYKASMDLNESEAEELRELNTISSTPSPDNLASPYYLPLTNMKILGYMKPYPFSLFVDSYHEKGIPSAVKIDNMADCNAAMMEFASMDRPWGQYPQVGMIKKAMAITRKLNSHANQKYYSVGLDSSGKTLVIIAQDLRLSPGLPFAADPTKKFQIDYVERGLNLAIEINESAKKNPPSKVKVPPSIYGLRQTKRSGIYGEYVYPMALQILENRFAVHLKMRGYSETPNDSFPSRYHGPHGLSKEKLVLKSEYYFIVEFYHMDFDMHPDLIDFALSIIQKWIVMKPEDVKVWEFLKYYLINTPVLLPSGQLVRKQGGTTSGSYFGNLAKCVVAGFIGVYCMLNQGLEREYIEGKVHCEHNELILAVPRTFSTSQFTRDVDDLGFRTREFRTVDNSTGKVTVIKTTE